MVRRSLFTDWKTASKLKERQRTAVRYKYMSLGLERADALELSRNIFYLFQL